jgi:glycosyltransferase involved in cell wall biosynthesis
VISEGNHLQKEFFDLSRSLEFFVPYYDSIEYLTECLSSLNAQSDGNFKVTVIDDGSSNGQAASLVDEMKDNRFLYIKNVRNLGVPGNFQKCVDSSTSDWVVIIGHDDKLPPDYVQSIRHHLTDMTFGFLQPKVEIIDSAGARNENLVDRVKFYIRGAITGSRKQSKALTGIKVEPKAIMPWFLIGNPFYFPTIVWNRSVLQNFGFKQDLPITLDYDLIFRFLNNGFSIKFLEDTTAIYRRHSESASGKLTSMMERLDEESRVLKSFLLQIEESTLLIKLIVLMRPTIRFHAMVLALNDLRYGRFVSAQRYLRHFFKV